jgi:hypothetical protein
MADPIVPRPAKPTFLIAELPVPPFVTTSPLGLP